jgi:hypothetical protein
MNLTTRKAERAKQAREKKQLKKDIAEANKDFLTNFFKHLNDEK